MGRNELKLPLPEVKPQPITYGQYRTLTPEKLELYDGYLIEPSQHHDGRMRLLAALLVKEGLARTVHSAVRL